ncbi:MAG: metal ABC transporter permease [Planctomycetes bacterium]|nr:metal ABC transporter permease [Planctomycetota bacterium]
MRTLEYFADPAMREMYLSALLAALPVVVTCGVLSVPVVVKRLGFVGQGVSHAAFGGVGVAALVGAFGLMPATEWNAALAQMCIIVAFCGAAALGIAAVSDRRAMPVDTAIGVFLVASMAVGAVLVQVSRGVAEQRGHPGMVQSWESILFGSVIGAGWGEVVISAAVCCIVLGTLWWWRRPLTFWALDEESARAFGVPGGRMKTILMLLLAVAVVAAMKLAGVILATALLVLPGATALKLTVRLRRAVVLACVLGIGGLLAGLVLSIETDWQTGPSVVLVLTVLFFAVTLAKSRGVLGAA